MKDQLDRLQRDLEGAYEMKAQVDMLRAKGVLEVDQNNRLVVSQPVSEILSEIEAPLEDQLENNDGLIRTRAERKAQYDSKMKE